MPKNPELSRPELIEARRKVQRQIEILETPAYPNLRNRYVIANSVAELRAILEEIEIELSSRT